MSSLRLDDVEPFSTHDPELEPLARELVADIMEFALGDGQAVPAPAGAPGSAAHEPWKGRFGACASKESLLGDWFNELPTKSCLEAVSSSILARVNKLGKVVRISVRGPKQLVAMDGKVPVETDYREKKRNASGADEVETIESFLDCAGGGKVDSADERCGWSPRYVGECQVLQSNYANTRTVKLKVKSDHPQNSPVFARVCQGIHGCNREGYGSDDVRRKYIDHVASFKFAAGGDEVEFPCPKNGPVVEKKQNNVVVERIHYGHFSVMLSEPDPAVDVVASGVGKVTYPAREVDVFRYREGAFYGNIFDSASDAGAGKALFDKQYACYGEDLNEGKANIADRLCALPVKTAEEKCFVNVPRSCAGRPGEGPGVCKPVNHGDNYVYSLCEPGAPSWDYPITVYLTHPCDLRGDPDCSSLRFWSHDLSPPSERF
ncbi:hypothetical protein BE17_10645 [Sorangium cellulosum]|uniref:Uncharacterized protein n=1 Tax=Sorangium cellulosum TaxID=56 RepID=A0A150RAB9_SORCE|nr:hypothetical protein BE17_10645 [Sorangium cellulosum]